MRIQGALPRHTFWPCAIDKHGIAYMNISSVGHGFQTTCLYASKIVGNFDKKNMQKSGLRTMPYNTSTNNPFVSKYVLVDLCAKAFMNV